MTSRNEQHPEDVALLSDSQSIPELSPSIRGFCFLLYQYLNSFILFSSILFWFCCFTFFSYFPWSNLFLLDIFNRFSLSTSWKSNCITRMSCISWCCSCDTKSKKMLSSHHKNAFSSGQRWRLHIYWATGCFFRCNQIISKWRC